MNEAKNRFEILVSRIKTHPIMTLLIGLGAIVIALSSFTDAAKNLLSLVDQETRPDIYAQWKADVTYDWPGARYTETFTFGGEGDAMNGTASFLGRKVGILEATLREKNLQFITRTRAFSGDTVKEMVHHYQGTVVGDEIKFIMQTEGDFSEHVPIQFIAKKVPKATEK